MNTMAQNLPETSKAVGPCPGHHPGERPHRGRTAKSMGTAVGDAAAKEGHPWGSREDDNIIEETLNEQISKFCPLALAVSLGSCQ